MSGSNPVVKTNSGAVKGISKETDVGKKYFSFQHIPYVEQPKGDLRFKDPKPVKPWNDILDCTKEGSPAYCLDFFLPNGPKVVGSDDCLGVNVFTPNLKPAKPLPVFVWIHGGGFVCGSSSTLFYGPDYIVEKDVILVSFNYRLNIFGFLSLKDPKVGVPGNAGLKDQTMALKWIKENISCFGGDSNNITIVGESAGGASVHYHLISPLSKGLFNRAISLSGSALNPWATASQNYDKYFKKLVFALGLTGNEDDMTIFKKISETKPEKLIEIDMGLVDHDQIVLGDELMSIFVPQVEPYVSEMCFLPKSPLELGREAWSKYIDVIFGGTANEGMMNYFFSPMGKQLEMMNQDHSYLIPNDIRSKLNSDEVKSKASLLKNLYFGDNDISEKTMEQYINYSNENQFWHGIYRAIMQRNGQGKTFIYHINVEPSTDSPAYYEFVRKLCKMPNMKGMAHGEDIPLLFKTAFAPRFKPTDDIYQGQQVYLKILTDFCKSGKVENWDPLDKNSFDSVKCMSITGEGSQMVELPNMTQLRVWNKIYDAKELF